MGGKGECEGENALCRDEEVVGKTSKSETADAGDRVAVAKGLEGDWLGTECEYRVGDEGDDKRGGDKERLRR